MRDSTTPRDVRLAELARRQHGVVGVGQLRALGFDRDAIARREASGRLHRLYRGVYAVGHTVLKREGRYLAAVLACGAGAALSHRSAGALWGIRPSAAARFDVAVPRTSGVRTSSAIVIHRPRRPVETTTLDGIPVTTPGQTLADLATALPRRPLEKAVEMAEAARLHVVVPEDHPGAKRLAEAAQRDLTTTTRSPLEDAFLELCDAHGIPRPRVNVIVDGYEVDFCWPELRLIVETDGYEHHGTRAAFERDRARDARLTARGWRVLRFSDAQVRGGAGSTAEVVLAARRAAALEAGDGSAPRAERVAEHPDGLGISTSEGSRSARNSLIARSPWPSTPG
jgi:very-short-patch-repair endonuclease